MANNRVAVLDLGTNTFHILIADLIDNGEFEVVLKERRIVYLGGANVDRIDPEAFQRGIEALVEFRKLIDLQNVVRYRAIGTAALRKAKNNHLFIKEAKEKANIDIELITGNEEANYIAKGISQTYTDQTPHLIMDIGGGSVEFIMGASSIEWSQSFETGISILYHQFMKTDPIQLIDHEDLFKFLDQKLNPLKQACDRYKTFDLIGAAGTFEILAKYQHGLFDRNQMTLNVSQIRKLYEQCKTMSLGERQSIDGIPSHRAKYLVVSLSLIIYVLDHVNISEVHVSAHSLKEGVLLDF